MSGREDDITAWFKEQSHLDPETFPIGIGDDMAEVRINDFSSVLVTTDMLLDGTHFNLETAGLRRVGYKAMAVSLSDCAAMATIPLAAVVAVALPVGFRAEELKELHAGINLAAEKYHCPLIGGDITSWQGTGRFAINVAMLSKRSSGKPIRRDGAKPGDGIYVTGSLGGSACGRHLEFEPRVYEALRLAETVTVNAMMDISDGLSTDLNRICRQSGVGAIVEATAIPISAEAQAQDDSLGAALNDGEDFELLFTVSTEQGDRLTELWTGAVPITKIGTITETLGMQLRLPDATLVELKPQGFDHLKE